MEAALLRFVGHCIDGPLMYKERPYKDLAVAHLRALKQLYSGLKKGEEGAIARYKLEARPFQLLLAAEVCDDAEILARIIAVISMYGERLCAS